MRQGKKRLSLRMVGMLFNRTIQVWNSTSKYSPILWGLPRNFPGVLNVNFILFFFLMHTQPFVVCKLCANGNAIQFLANFPHANRISLVCSNCNILTVAIHLIVADSYMKQHSAWHTFMIQQSSMQISKEYVLNWFWHRFLLYLFSPSIRSISLSMTTEKRSFATLALQN